MIILRLFSSFFIIGLVSFGGGYGMIPLIRETVLKNGWLSEEQFVNLVAVAESTPGPVAVNAATFVGSGQAGILGSAAATFGVVLPSFIIILIIASAIGNLLKYRPVRNFLSGVRPCVVALIIATAVTLSSSVFVSGGAVDLRSIAVFLLLSSIHIVYGKKTGKTPSPIAMIVVSAVMGIVFWGLIRSN